MIALLVRWGLLREPMTPLELCAWHMIAIGIAEATPHRRLG